MLLPLAAWRSRCDLAEACNGEKPLTRTVSECYSDEAPWVTRSLPASHSRNRVIADILNRALIATLLFDLLTPEEQSIDEETRKLRLDIALLSGRVICAVDWAHADPRTADLPLGLFGASTGAAAALCAAAERRREVRAVVCRGARLDLAAGALPQVVAPTLLMVGSMDREILRLNRAAADQMPVKPRLDVISGATHLFEEAGKLDDVGQRGRDWFLQHFRETPRAGAEEVGD
jgi:putative phosphoribosyl transferase